MFVFLFLFLCALCLSLSLSYFYIQTMFWYETVHVYSITETGQTPLGVTQCSRGV